MNNCDCCFNDFLAKCEEEIVINTNLTTGDSYRWVITNKFGNKYEGTAIAGADGELTIPVEDLPPGMFTQYSSDFTLHLFGADSCSPIKFKLTGEYDCVTFNIHGGTFEKNNIGCTTTFVPGMQPTPTLGQVVDAGNNADGQIKNVTAPTEDGDAVNLAYLNAQIAAIPASPTPTLAQVLAEGSSAEGDNITDLADPSSPLQAANAKYVDELIEISETKAAIVGGTRKRMVLVRTDESNNNDGSIYMHDGSGLIFLLTIPV